MFLYFTTLTNICLSRDAGYFSCAILCETVRLPFFSKPRAFVTQQISNLKLVLCVKNYLQHLLFCFVLQISFIKITYLQSNISKINLQISVKIINQCPNSFLFFACQLKIPHKNVDVLSNGAATVTFGMRQDPTL